MKEYFPPEDKLRDQFAALAMPQLLATTDTPVRNDEQLKSLFNEIARQSYMLADSMMREREK